jgi:hypothetical protein
MGRKTKNKPIPILPVTLYGAVGDGETSDYTAFSNTMAALPAGMFMYVPEGDFLLPIPNEYGSGLNIKSGAKIIMHPNANIIIPSNGYEEYYIFNIYGVSDVFIMGGNIIGDKLSHTGETGEWGHGINIAGSDNITIVNMNISNCWGDGIYIGEEYEGQDFSQNVNITGVICDGNRRNGISVVSVKGLNLINYTAINQDGTAPQSGLDLEPNHSGQFLINVNIENYLSYDNTGYGITMYLELSGTVPIENVSITIHNHRSNDTAGTYGNFLDYLHNGYNIVVTVDSTITNLLTNPEFAGTTGWSSEDGFCTINASDNMLSATGDGSQPFMVAFQKTGLPFSEGTELFCSVQIKCNNNVNTSLYFELRDGEWYDDIIGETGGFTTPPADTDTWYTLSFIATVGVGGSLNTTFVCRNGYENAETQNGKIMTIKNPIMVDLSDYGDYVPSLEELNVIYYNAA